jgi:tRNA(Ile)-lysidine synthase
MLKTVKETIEDYSMLVRGDHVLVAVSGGPDSVALLRILVLLASEYELSLTTAHLNHGLRGAQAEKEETFVRQLCEGMRIPCICKRIDVRNLKKGMSLEEISREVRYRFLYDEAQACGAGIIATGHHRDDQAETVLLNLIRGSGPEGLRGIAPVRAQRIIRPLLRIGRDKILDFLSQEGLPYMVDESNADRRFLRNRIRNGLIPELKACYNPRIVSGLCHTAEIMRRQDDYLLTVVRQILDQWGVGVIPGSDTVRVPISSLMNLHEALQGRIVKYLLEGAAESGNGIGYRHIQAVLALCRQGHRRDRLSLDLPGRICVERDGGKLCVKRTESRPVEKGRRDIISKSIAYSYPVGIPSAIHLREVGRMISFRFIVKPCREEMVSQPRAAFMDFDRICPPLTLRNMQPGDRIEPLGMVGQKKIKDYFIDQKTPYQTRRMIPLLVDNRSVIWIAGERISERVKVDEKTKNVLKAEMV